MKILHINSADKTGGAAIAAFRHSQALNSAGIESAMLVVNKSSNDPMVLRPEHSGKFTSVKSHISAFLHSKYISRYSPYATWSYPLTGFDLSKEKCVREADVIFLHWVPVLTIRQIEAILRLGKPTYWFLHDMWPFTGGCHYSFDCTKYLYSCSDCNLLKNKKGLFKKDIARKLFLKKTKHILPYKNLEVLAPRRLAMDDGSAGMSDCILQIGTANTIETYPEAIQPKIRLIHQSSNLLSNDFRRTGFKKTKFLWLGSSGSILKGVDLVIEAFLRHPELEIDIVGPVENEVKAVYAKQLHNASNIRFHGYVDVNSHRFMNIVSDTAFLIYPSVTEGFPGAVIAGMKLGLVPLVSKIAAPECIESFGYQLNDISLHSIEQALQWSQNLSENQIKERSDAVVQYSTLFSIERFGQEFNRFLDDICRTAASN